MSEDKREQNDGQIPDDFDLEKELDLDTRSLKDAEETAAKAEAEAGAVKPTLEMREEEKKPLISDNAKKEIREWVVSFAFALIAFFLIRMFLFTVISVDGQSMETTLHDGERMIVTVLDMKIGDPQRGDVVICHYPNRQENFVKRVIGVPGDIIAMSGGVTYVNMEPVEEPYVADPDMRSYGPYLVPEGNYFVCGDNRNHSNDSRMEGVGFISRDKFIGKVRFVMWPLGNMRIVH